MLGFLGGTGPEGRGLALRFALSGEKVFIGSRSTERGFEAAQSLKAITEVDADGGTNERAAEIGDVIFAAMPYGGQRATLESVKGSLHGKILINVVAPLLFNRGKISTIKIEEGSAAVQAQETVPEAKVVGAFHNISAEDLLIPVKNIDSDVIVCADDESSKSYVMELAEKIEGIRGVDGGALENSRYVEELTALLLNINKVYKAHSSIRITGL